ncbi:MAG: cysteine desulfurase family protein [Clostridiaceae bacterium]|nr:cysteine desulfurase family protein [Clostridiaceae bacterium]MDY5889453.1 cysteine desulfurase family protein [Oscillospiraceae bacterium]
MEAYLDNSATTQPCKEAVEKMNYALRTCWGNPSSLHSKGIAASELLEEARNNIAKKLSCESDEIFFTSGGTESNNIAVFGAANAQRRRGSRIITTSIEHSSVEESVKALENQGYDVVRLRVNERGVIDERQLYAATNPSVVLISMMYVNNEVGSIQPVEFAKRAVVHSGANALIHCDAVQAFGKVQLKPYNMGVDLMTVSSHKIHGPKGAGALFVKKGTKLVQHSFGGLQENKIRPGTEPLPAIAGFGAAAAAIPDYSESLKYVTDLRNYMVAKLRTIEGVRINSPENALPYITNISVEGIPSEVMLNYLSGLGICVSSGSACSKGHKSRVLKAMNLSDDVINTALRISLSVFTTKEEIDYLIGGIASALKTMRRLK